MNAGDGQSETDCTHPIWAAAQGTGRGQPRCRHRRAPAPRTPPRSAATTDVCPPCRPRPPTPPAHVVRFERRRWCWHSDIRAGALEEDPDREFGVDRSHRPTPLVWRALSISAWPELYCVTRCDVMIGCCRKQAQIRTHLPIGISPMPGHFQLDVSELVGPCCQTGSLAFASSSSCLTYI